MKIMLASKNRNKAKELVKILSPREIVLPEDMGIDYDFEETGKTYLDNALGKAMGLYRITGIPVIGEDSGLSVPALNGEPGVYSARYGSSDGIKLSDTERNSWFLEKMRGITDRKAFFVCSMVLVLDSYRFYVCQETVNGIITEEPSGSGGFGYDPVFYVEEFGKTMAELTDEEKNSISHRGKAGRAIASVLKEISAS